MSVNLTSKMIGEVHHPLAYWTCPTTGLFITNENESETCWCSTSTSLKNAKVFPAFSPIFWRVSRKNLGIYCTTLGCPRSHYYMYEMSEAILKVGKVASAALRAETLRSFSRRMQKHTLFEKSNFCPKIQFWQNPNIFPSFSPKFFLTIFLVKSKLSIAKKSKTTTFSRIFHPKTIDNFFGKSKLNFWTKKWKFRTVWLSTLS